MPVTRSQKDAPSRPSDKDVTGEMSGSEGVTSASAAASSGTATTSVSSGTTTTEDTTTTETTVATATTAACEEKGQKHEAAQKETTKKQTRAFMALPQPLSQRGSFVAPGPEDTSLRGDGSGREKN
ncbi:unnamed protein product [Parnassius apollo]|uniref:(apollo) hypothetical protein n=1 Tax=Parnassius apollo TaxID=110799 RepID=A0A8S3XM61_PARAO|nr:unnamed protein product [Parnassius apollo]